MRDELPPLRADQRRCKICDAICTACEDKLCVGCREKEDAYCRADFEFDRKREDEMITGYALNPCDDGWDD